MTWRRVREFLRRYRFLMIVYVPALALAAWEIGGRIYDDSKAPDPESKKIAEQFTLDYAKLHQELYPDRPRSEYFKGMEALYLKKDPQTARKHFEAALATGVKTDEQLLYYYAYTLVTLKEDPAKIDAAVRNWRINFPRSTYPDPRTARISGGAPAKPPRVARPYPQSGDAP